MLSTVKRFGPYLAIVAVLGVIAYFAFQSSSTPARREGDRRQDGWVWMGGEWVPPWEAGGL